MLFQKNMVPGENNSSQNLELQVNKAQVCSEPAMASVPAFRAGAHRGVLSTTKGQLWN